MSEWIDVKERLPEDGREVLGCFAGGLMGVVQYMPKCSCERKWHGDNYRYRSLKPTHWMELPLPAPSSLAAQKETD